jgi:hypothetical protein
MGATAMFCQRSNQISVGGNQITSPVGFSLGFHRFHPERTMRKTVDFDSFPERTELQ